MGLHIALNVRNVSMKNQLIRLVVYAKKYKSRQRLNSEKYSHNENSSYRYNVYIYLL